MSDSISHNVVGRDGVKPSWNPEANWKIWGLHEIFRGEEGSRELSGARIPLWVPNVLDYVENIYTHETFQVTELPQNTLVAKLEPIVRNANSLSEKDILSAMGPGLGASDHKIMIDDTVYPYRMDVSPFMEIRAVEAKYAKIVRGSTLGDHRVVGFIMGGNGQLIDDKIPLDLIRDVSGVVNYHQKNVRVCFTNEVLKNGDVLTVCLYSSSGNLLSENQLTVVLSNFMRDGNAPREYITGIQLESPYLSTSDPNELQLPLNWNNSSMNMVGVVNYQSGRKVRLPLDNDKFYLEGLHQHLSAIPGHPFNLTLKYALGPKENTVHDMSSFSKTIARNYRVRQVKVNNSYTVKIYAFPYWDQASSGYKLRFFIANLDRSIFMDVTGFVKFVAGTPVFNGQSFGTTQNLQVSLNLRDVFTTYKPFVHTQVIKVSLYGTPQDYRSPFLVQQANNELESFGTDIHAKRTIDGRSFTITSGFTTKEEWLEAMFHRSYPLTADSLNPTNYPTPTHMDIKIGNTTYTRLVDEWQDEFTIPGDILTTFPSVTVIWKQVNPSDTLVISGSQMILQSYY